MATQVSQDEIAGTTLGYAQITANFTTASTTAVQVTGLSVTVTVPAGGRRVRISFFSQYVTNSGTNNTSVAIYDGTVPSGTLLNFGSYYDPTATGGVAGNVSAIVTPTAGSHTYNIGCYASAGTGQINAGADHPAYILVELI